MLPGARSDTGGSRCATEKNTTINTEPTTNSGIAVNTSITVKMIWSGHRPAVTPASTPSRSESGIRRITVMRATVVVFSSGDRIGGQIGALIAATAIAELPRSPWRASASQLRYRVRTGLS